jgi:hypothetical protein
MIIEININCETEEEILAHLSEIRKEVKSEIRKQKGELTTPATIEESKYYGDHTINIIPDCSKEAGHFPDGNGFCLSCGSQLSVI